MSTRSRTAAAVVLLSLLPLRPGSAATSTLSYSGDAMSTVLAEGNQRAVLSGNARVQTEDTLILADRIELFGKDFIYANCSGNVKVVNTKKGMELTSQTLYYDRQEKIARVSGNAVLSDLKNELVVKGGFIEDRDKDQLTVVQIGVRILKKDLVCRAEFARYYREKKMLELSGLPWVSRKGDEYRAARITVNLDTEEITLEGDVTGEITTEKQAAPEEKPTPPEGKPAAPEGKPADTSPAPAEKTPPEAGSPPGAAGGG
jgi:lipopolysaccharide export system protein LptA